MWPIICEQPDQLNPYVPPIQDLIFLCSYKKKLHSFWKAFSWDLECGYGHLIIQPQVHLLRLGRHVGWEGLASSQHSNSSQRCGVEVRPFLQTICVFLHKSWHIMHTWTTLCAPWYCQMETCLDPLVSVQESWCHSQQSTIFGRIGYVDNGIC